MVGAVTATRIRNRSFTLQWRQRKHGVFTVHRQVCREVWSANRIRA